MACFTPLGKGKNQPLDHTKYIRSTFSGCNDENSLKKYLTKVSNQEI